MKIAIPYENGQVFPHFGRAAQFKIYTVNEEEILSSEVFDTPGTGHSAVAPLLTEKGVNVVICQGIGVAAVGVLKEANIQILGGASGDADQQVIDFLNGKIHFEAPGATCFKGYFPPGGCEGCTAHSGEDGPECDGNISACGNPCT